VGTLLDKIKSNNQDGHEHDSNRESIKGKTKDVARKITNLRSEKRAINAVAAELVKKIWETNQKRIGLGND
jgi:hypothetical protein